MVTTQISQSIGVSDDRLEKAQIETTIQTVTNRVVGNIYIREWERVKDAFNNLDERFIALTDVTVYNFRGQLLHQCEFMVINVDHIVWLNPNDSEQYNNRSNGLKFE